jgi:uncharacterized OB-fold protein
VRKELSETSAKQQQSSREKFIASANKGKILANKCTKCGHLVLETVFFCEKCAANKFEPVELGGTGTVVTYTIQAVAPEGFEDAGPYAWVVFKVDNSQLRVSGFLGGIKKPADLPIGSKVKVNGFSPKYGLLIEKLAK